jgi:ketosteroid isomerase-like protein
MVPTITRIGGAVAQANVELVRGVYDAFAQGDVDAVFAAMEPDVEWDESEGMPYGGVYRGRDAIVENVFGPILADVEDFTAAPYEILALDDARVMARGRHGGKGAAGPVDARFVHIWTVTDGKVSRYEQLADTRRFCDAVGR